MGEGRGERKKRESRDRIIAAAAELFIERGSRGVSLDEVAEAADVARRTLFNYFPSKEELLYAVAAPMLEEASALAEARLAGGPGDMDGIYELCLRLWRSWGIRLKLLYSIEFEGTERLAGLHASYLGTFGRLLAEAASRDLGLAPYKKLVGKVVYRCFVPLLLALEGEEDSEGRFRAGMRALVAGALGSAEQ
jgi:AcrR family transcriptional regulator